MTNLPDHVGNITEHTVHHNPMHHGGDFDDTLIPKTVDDRIMQHVNNGLRELTIATRPRVATQLRTQTYTLPVEVGIQIAQFNPDRKRISIGLTTGAEIYVASNASAFAGLGPITSTGAGTYFIYNEYSNFPDIEYVGALYAYAVTSMPISVMEESY